MAGSLFYPVSSVLAQGALVAAHLAGATVRLFKSGISLRFGITLPQLEAAQCDFDGYPVGGVAVPSWTAPILGPGQQAVITAGLVQFAFVGGGAGITNIVGGFYVVTSGGVLWIAAEFPEPWPAQIPGVGLPVAIACGFPSQ